jgi:hypothetical protein
MCVGWGRQKKSNTEFWSRKLYDRDYMKALGRRKIILSPSLGKQIVRKVHGAGSG